MMGNVLFIASGNPFIKGGGSQAILAYMESIIDIYGKDCTDIMIPQECIVPLQYADIKYLKVKRRSTAEKCLDYLTGNLSRFTKPIIKANGICQP